MSLVAFDFDGTLSDVEMTVLLGTECGVADEMIEITRRAMNGELAYPESLRQRCALLEGLAADRATAAFDRVTLRPGAATLLRALDEAGVRTAILTGGFERGVESALDDANVTVDDIVANRLQVVDGTLTGEVTGPLVEGTKDGALASLAEARGVPLADTVAVGDGANDVPMLETAGLAIGFEPKPAVASSCDVVVSSMAELQDALENAGIC